MSRTGNKLAAAFETHRRGDLAGAERQYRALLRQQPGNPDLLYLLAMLCLDSARPDQAAKFFQRAIDAAESQARRIDPSWLLALGTAQQRQDDHAAALKTFERALAGDPTSVDALFCRATALQSLARTDDAIAAYTTLLDRAPRHVEAAYNFGLLLRDAGKPLNAIRALRKAVLLQPEHAAACAALAPVLEDVGWRDEAIEVYRRAVALAPDDMDLVSKYSRCLMTANMMEDAEAVLRRMLARHPDSHPLLAQQAALRMFQNDHHEAARIARRVLTESDAFPAVHATLAEAEREGDHDAAIAEIAAALKPGVADRRAEAALEFAWARRLEYLQRYEEAIDHYARGNAAKRASFEERGIAYDRDREARSDAQLAAVVSAGDAFDRRGSDSELPLFIVGMPRSGTTLTEQILASHPQMAGAGELSDIGNAARRLGEALDYPRQAPTEAALRKVAGHYLARLRRVDGAALRVIDKMPGNFRHLGLIASLFPNARIVLCRRDPMDTCLSCYFQNFDAPGLSWSFSFDDLAHQYRRYRSVMARWQEMLPIRILDVDYEHTVDDLEAQARRLVAFAGLEWDDSCLDFHASKQAVITASHSQVRQPIYRSSVGRWRRYGAGVLPLYDRLADVYAEDAAALSGGIAAGSPRG